MGTAWSGMLGTACKTPTTDPVVGRMNAAGGLNSQAFLMIHSHILVVPRTFFNFLRLQPSGQASKAWSGCNAASKL